MKKKILGYLDFLINADMSSFAGFFCLANVFLIVTGFMLGKPAKELNEVALAALVNFIWWKMEHRIKSPKVTIITYP